MNNFVINCTEAFLNLVLFFYWGAIAILVLQIICFLCNWFMPKLKENKVFDCIYKGTTILSIAVLAIGLGLSVNGLGELEINKIFTLAGVYAIYLVIKSIRQMMDILFPSDKGSTINPE